MRRQCAEEEVLMDYLEGRLPERARLKVEQHLSRCDLCVEELVVAGKLGDMASSLSLEPVPEQITGRAAEIVRKLGRKPFFDKISRYVKSVLSKCRNGLTKPWPGMNLSLAPVRGSKTVLARDLILLRKSFSDFEVHIEIEKTSDGRVSILVRLPEVDKSENAIRTTLMKNGREMSSFLCVDQTSTFEEVPFGRYTLSFSRDGAKIGEYAFIIKETSHGIGQEQ